VIHDLLNPHWWLDTVGTIGLIAIIFAETGLLVGFFLPGDSLLVIAGGLAAQGHLNLAAVVLGCTVAAIAGAETGYFIGAKAGPALFNRPKSRLFKPEHVERAQHYFEKYGNRTIVVARFIPIVRTFANPVAGVSRMDVRTFTIYNMIGGVVWASGLTLGGYWFGNKIKDVYLIPGVIILSLIPIGVEFFRHRRAAGVPPTH
jgi:membrane-associated protein